MLNGLGVADLISQTNLANARDVFPETRPPAPQGPRPHLAKLLDAPQSAERNALLGRYLQICDEVDAYLADAAAQRIADLEQTSAQLKSACRGAEDEVKSYVLELARLSGRLNAKSSELNGARQRVADASVPGYDTRYPTAAEREEWEKRKRAAQAALANAQQEYRDVAGAIQSSELQRRAAAARLRELDQELSQVIGELERLNSA